MEPIEQIDAGGTSSGNSIGGGWREFAKRVQRDGLAANHLQGPIRTFMHVLDHLPSLVKEIQSHQTDVVHARFSRLDVGRSAQPTEPSI